MRGTGGLQAIGHPLRVQVLDALREPASAAGVARRIGHPRQKVNYHLKELEHTGLVRRVGERRVGNFVEALYQSVARAIVVFPEVAWSDPRRLEALRSQHALESLVLLGERLQRDAAALLDRAAFDGEHIPSAAVSADVGFADERARAAFMKAYLRATKRLVDRYATRGGERFRVSLAIYPDTEEGD